MFFSDKRLQKSQHMFVRKEILAESRNQCLCWEMSRDILWPLMQFAIFHNTAEIVRYTQMDLCVKLQNVRGHRGGFAVLRC